MKIIECTIHTDYTHFTNLLREYLKLIKFEEIEGDIDSELDNSKDKYIACLVAYENDIPAGIIALYKTSDNICELKRMFVKSEFRNKGIGHNLVRNIVKIAKNKGFEKIQLDTCYWMKYAHHVYKSYGFVEVETHSFKDKVLSSRKYFELNLLTI